MSNYTKNGTNLAYKEPQFMGRVAYVPDDELQPGDPDDLKDVVQEGDTWIVRKGTKYEVKVSSGADTYFGTWQSLYTTMEETGILENINDEIVIEIPEEYRSQDPQQNDPNNPNGDPNNNGQQNNNQN